MITKISNGKIVSDNKIIENLTVYIKDGNIIAVTDENLDYDVEINAEGNYISPGFIDIHVHGGAGYEFVDATKEAVLKASEIHAQHGTTTIYPTISAYDYEKTVNALKIVNEVREEALPNIYGCHLEGPYFSPLQTGAQDPDFIRTPDEEEYTKLYEAFGDIIERWSYAPELENADKFLEFLNEKGIVAAAGHTDAIYDDMLYAYKNGMKLITHLYSCTSTITRKDGFRRLGVIETAYLYDDIDVEIIADGCHLPPELLKLIYKIKSDDHMCLVTDAIRFGGMNDSDNLSVEHGNRPYLIEDGVAKLLDRSAFAGSIATTDVLIRTCVKKAEIDLSSAVKMLTEVPARIMKLNKKGFVKEGFDADLVVFDDYINIKYTIVNGKVVYKNV